MIADARQLPPGEVPPGLAAADAGQLRAGVTPLLRTWKQRDRSGQRPTRPGTARTTFTALGDRLVRRGVVADVFIVGGAAMALAYDATRVTRDVDSLFVPTVSSWKKQETLRRNSGCRRGG